MGRILVLAMLAGFWVAGCSAGVPSDGGTLRGFLGGGAGSSAPLTRATLAGGDVRLTGPSGYCIDPETLRVEAQQSFALLASCHILSEGRSGASVPPLLIAVTVGAKGSGDSLPDPQTLATAASAPLLEARAGDGLSLALLGRGGDVAFDGVDPRYWRGAFVQGGRLVGVALYVPRGSDISPARGAEMLQSLRVQVRADSPGEGRASGESQIGRLDR